MRNIYIFPLIFLWALNRSNKKHANKQTTTTTKLCHLFGPCVLQNNRILISTFKVLNIRILLKIQYFFLFLLLLTPFEEETAWSRTHCHKLASTIKLKKWHFNVICPVKRELLSIYLSMISLNIFCPIPNFMQQPDCKWDLWRWVWLNVHLLPNC